GIIQPEKELHTLLQKWRQSVDAPVPTKLNPSFKQQRSEAKKMAIPLRAKQLVKKERKENVMKTIITVSMILLFIAATVSSAGNRLNSEWNKLHIEAIGNSIRTWLNGVPAANLRDSMTREGLIALQVHARPKSGIQVKWRTIRILDLGTLVEWPSVVSGQAK
ncbi:MAG: DUF1080 domain-containing protein, partial [Calditrichaeota bacterium]|nr:DUF1080 domain-containing protein [Calditrichota bacterium]